jgi:hypothetical protein
MPCAFSTTAYGSHYHPHNGPFATPFVPSPKTTTLTTNYWSCGCKSTSNGKLSSFLPRAMYFALDDTARFQGFEVRCPKHNDAEGFGDGWPELRAQVDEVVSVEKPRNLMMVVRGG